MRLAQAHAAPRLIALHLRLSKGSRHSQRLAHLAGLLLLELHLFLLLLSEVAAAEILVLAIMAALAAVLAIKTTLVLLPALLMPLLLDREELEGLAVLLQPLEAKAISAP